MCTVRPCTVGSASHPDPSRPIVVAAKHYSADQVQNMHVFSLLRSWIRRNHLPSPTGASCCAPPNSSCAQNTPFLSQLDGCAEDEDAPAPIAPEARFKVTASVVAMSTDPSPVSSLSGCCVVTVHAVRHSLSSLSHS